MRKWPPKENYRSPGVIESFTHILDLCSHFGHFFTKGHPKPLQGHLEPNH
jgi:hypothetical protein